LGDGVPYHAQSGLSEISRKSWMFLILSGLATGASWLCYFKALQLGHTSKVVAIDKLSIVITLVLAVIFLYEEFYIQVADWFYFDHDWYAGYGAVSKSVIRSLYLGCFFLV